jgi:hypothetical protein
VRVVWGGDGTIRRVRQAPLAPRATEVTFADRWSLMVADAQTVTNMDDQALSAAAQGFYNDTYLLDQNACTAPRLVYWLGGDEALARAQERFWTAVHAYAAPRYPVDPVAAVDKLTVLYRAALTLPGAALAPMPDNLVSVSLTAHPACRPAGSGGCFPEYASISLDDLTPAVTAKTQPSPCWAWSRRDTRPALAAGRGVDRVWCREDAGLFPREGRSI